MRQQRCAWTQTCCRDWSENSRRWAKRIGRVQRNYCIICLIVLQGEDAHFAGKEARADLFGNVWSIFHDWRKLDLHPWGRAGKCMLEIFLLLLECQCSMSKSRAPKDSMRNQRYTWPKKWHFFAKDGGLFQESVLLLLLMWRFFHLSVLEESK